MGSDASEVPRLGEREVAAGVFGECSSSELSVVGAAESASGHNKPEGAADLQVSICGCDDEERGEVGVRGELAFRADLESVTAGLECVLELARHVPVRRPTADCR